MTILYFIILLIFKVKCQTNVPELNMNEINEYLSTSDYLVLYLFQDNCEKCPEVNSLFQEAVSQLTSSSFNIKFGKFDCSNHKDWLKSLDLISIPAIMFFNVARDIHYDYIGGWNVREIIKFILSHLNKDFKKIKNPQWLQNNKKVSLVVCGQTEKTDKLLEKINDIISAKENVDLLQAEGEDMYKFLNCSLNELSLYMIKQSEEKIVKFEGKASSERLEEWIDVYSLPFLLNLNEESFENSMHMQKPLIFLITQSKESEYEEKIRSFIEKKAKEQRVK